MPRQSAFVAFVAEQMARVGRTRVRAMFGGHGVYQDDRMVAIVVDDVLYLKADAETRPEFEGRGLRPFTYVARGERVALQYFEAPPEVFEDSDAMRAWLQKAYGAALRAAREVRPAVGRKQVRSRSQS